VLYIALLSLIPAIVAFVVLSAGAKKIAAASPVD
jgi:hypothetical protein